MTARPEPPEDWDENPDLDADFFARARPAAPGEGVRLRAVLQRIVEAHKQGRPMDAEVATASEALSRLQ